MKLSKSARWWLQNLSAQSIGIRAGRIVYQRGVNYYWLGKTSSLQWVDGQLQARVQGSDLYLVRFWRKGKDLIACCNCPFAIEGAFCKHQVAAALAAFDAISENGIPEQETG